MFPKSINIAKNKRKARFQKEMTKHIKRNFRYPDLAVDLGLEGRVDIYFVIDKNGNIINVRMRGPHEILEKEAMRIINKLPKMIPGKQQGIPVNVPFSLPINFRLQQ